MEYKAIRDWLSNAAQVFSARSCAVQVSALPCRINQGVLEVCLITSRGGGRWIAPKGWPETGLSDAEVAAQEAWEEAGLTGSVRPDKYASYAATKEIEPGTAIPLRIDVYLLLNPKQSKEFPELGQRKIKWFSIEKAMERVAETGLKDILVRLQSEGLPS